jgi:PTS system galactitol-specific IIB component
MKRILFVCATGGITSTVAEKQVQDACKEAGVSVMTLRCSPTQIGSHLDSIDMIVTTTMIGDNYPVPVIRALELITGIGKDAVLENIVKRAKENSA